MGISSLRHSLTLLLLLLCVATTHSRPHTLTHPSTHTTTTTTTTTTNHTHTHSHTVPFVDIIITVKTDIKYVRACVHSLTRHTPDPRVLLQRVVFVDDGSPTTTLAYEHELCESKPESFFCTVTSGVERGYTYAVEKGTHYITSLGQGHQESTAVVLLNSDTIVTDGWLVSLYDALMAKQHTMIVGPLSNAAVLQSVPTLELSENVVPLGLGIDTVAKEIRHYSRKMSMSKSSASSASSAVVPIAIVNGFCFMFKRAVLTHVKGFDTVNFGPGYGEEVDFCLRTKKKGFDALIVPDSYVFHTKTASFQSNEKKELNRKAHIVLDSKYKSMLDEFKVTRLSARKRLDHVAKHVSAVYEKYTRRLRDIQPPSILFVIPAEFPARDFIPILRLAFYLRAYKVNVRVEAIEWQAGDTTVAELLTVHFPDLSLADRMSVVSVRAADFSTGDSSAPTDSFQPRALRLRADIVLAVSLEAMSAVLRICSVNDLSLSQPALLLSDMPRHGKSGTLQLNLQLNETVSRFDDILTALRAMNITLAQSKVDSLSGSVIASSPSLRSYINGEDNKNIELYTLSPHINREVYYISPLEFKLKYVKRVGHKDKFNILVHADASPNQVSSMEEETFSGLKHILDKFKQVTVTIVFLTNVDRNSNRKEVLLGLLQHQATFVYANYSRPLHELSDLYRRSDVFLDVASWRSGTPEQLWLEVMACGCVVGLPLVSTPEHQHPLCPTSNRGLRPDEECFSVDMTVAANVFKKISLLLESHTIHKKLAVWGMERTHAYPQEEAALSFLEHVSVKKLSVILFGLDTSAFVSLFFALVIVSLAVLGIVYLRPASNPRKK